MAARHAGVHLTLFKYYFTDRTRLLVDVARQLSMQLGQNVAAIETSDLPAPERFRIRIDAMIDFYMKNPFYHRLMVEIIHEDAEPLATELINVWMSKTLDIYDAIIEKGVEEGTLRRVDPYFTFVAIMGLCEQFLHAQRLIDRSGYESDSGKGTGTTEGSVENYKDFIHDLLMRGIAIRPAG